MNLSDKAVRGAVLLGIVCLSFANAPAVQADASHYDGLQLAPTVHAAAAKPHFRAGLGVDLSVNRWAALELWGSRVSRPTEDRWYPGAWSTGIAIHSRFAWETHALVYGAGLVYTSAYHCPDDCSIFAAVVYDEPRSAVDMYALNFRLGYEARLETRWFFRALATFDVPFATRRVDYFDRSERYPSRESPFALMHASAVFTLGYVFRLWPT